MSLAKKVLPPSRLAFVSDLSIFDHGLEGHLDLVDVRIERCGELIRTEALTVSKNQLNPVSKGGTGSFRTDWQSSLIDPSFERIGKLPGELTQGSVLKSVEATEIGNHVGLASLFRVVTGEPIQTRFISDAKFKSHVSVPVSKVEQAQIGTLHEGDDLFKKMHVRDLVVCENESNSKVTLKCPESLTVLNFWISSIGVANKDRFCRAVLSHYFLPLMASFEKSFMNSSMTWDSVAAPHAALKALYTSSSIYTVTRFFVSSPRNRARFNRSFESTPILQKLSTQEAAHQRIRIKRHFLPLADSTKSRMKRSRIFPWEAGAQAFLNASHRPMSTYSATVSRLRSFGDITDSFSAFASTFIVDQSISHRTSPKYGALLPWNSLLDKSNPMRYASSVSSFQGLSMEALASLEQGLAPKGADMSEPKDLTPAFVLLLLAQKELEHKCVGCRDIRNFAHPEDYCVFCRAEWFEQLAEAEIKKAA